MDFVLLLFEFDRRSLSMAYFFLGVAFSTFAADERRRLSPSASDLAVSWIWAVGPAPSLSAVALLGADGVLPARLSYEHPGLPHRVSRSAVYFGVCSAPGRSLPYRPWVARGTVGEGGGACPACLAVLRLVSARRLDV